MNKQLKRLVASAALAFASLTAQAAPVVVDVTGVLSINLPGESGNTVMLIDIGPNALLNSLAWTLRLQAFLPSGLGDMQVSFGDSSGLNVINFSPDAADGYSGAGSYTGSLDLTGLGLGAGADGLLRLEFSEAYADAAPGSAEGQWLTGNLTFDVTAAAAAVPEPGSAALALLGLSLVGLRQRRKPRSR